MVLEKGVVPPSSEVKILIRILSNTYFFMQIMYQHYSKHLILNITTTYSLILIILVMYSNRSSVLLPLNSNFFLRVFAQ
jgi:hypothetical protein